MMAPPMLRPSPLWVVPLLLACDDAAPRDDASAIDSSSDAPVAYTPPTPDFPDEHDDRPFALSEVGLFDGDRIAPDLLAYTPNYPLWSDGLAKRRWLRLPAGATADSTIDTIDTTDPDRWQLPMGAILFKEFADADRPLETRVIARTGPGSFDYWMGAFRWRPDGSDADFVRAGEVDVLGTDHDVPSAERCWSCHVGTPGRVLGLTTLQLTATALAELSPHFSAPLPTPPPLPGSPEAQAALGYLHANCAHCHSPTGVARPDSDIDLSLSVADLTVADTGTWQTAVAVATRSWIRPDYPLRIAPGDPEHSAVIVRMHVRGDADQMPPLATEHIDEQGLAILSTWIASLPASGD